MINPLNYQQKFKFTAALSASVLWLLFLFVFSSLTEQAVQNASRTTINGISGLTNILFDMHLSPGSRRLLDEIARQALSFAGYAMLAILVWNALRLYGMRHRRSAILTFACTLLLSIMDELHLIFLPGRFPRVGDWLINCLGAAAALACIAAMQWMWRKFPRVINHETVSYVIFGALATLVNMMAYGFCFNTFGISNLVSNFFAWVAAVLFAYMTNKLFVFQSHAGSVRMALREFSMFIGARVFSFAVDELGMWLLVNVQGVNGGLSKIIMNIIVLIMNYFFSKQLIFKRETERDSAERLDGNDV